MKEAPIKFSANVKSTNKATLEEAKTHQLLLNGEWKIEMSDPPLFGFYFWTLQSSCGRVHLYKWLGGKLRAQMGDFFSEGKTAKSTLKNLKKEVTTKLTKIGAELVSPFPKF